MIFDATVKRLNVQPRARRAKRTSHAQAIQVPAYTQWPAL
jgi:hypothetical protein